MLQIVPLHHNTHVYQNPSYTGSKKINNQLKTRKQNPRGAVNPNASLGVLLVPSMDLVRQSHSLQQLPMEEKLRVQNQLPNPQ